MGMWFVGGRINAFLSSLAGDVCWSWVRGQDVNFPRGGGSPWRPDPNLVGVGAKFPPRGKRGGPPNVNGAGACFSPARHQRDPISSIVVHQQLQPS
jgi:hypothetical protein